MPWRCKRCRKFMLPNKILSSGLCISCSVEERTKEATTKSAMPVASNQNTPAKPVVFLPNPLQLYSKLSVQEKMSITQWYKTALECADIISRTKDIRVLLQRYDLMVQSLSHIAEIEPRVCFAGMTVRERIAILTEQKETLVFGVIVRDFNKACEKAAKLKTNKGRSNAMERFFSKVELSTSPYLSVAKILEKLRTHLADFGISPYLLADTDFLSAEGLCNFAVVYYKDGHIADCIPRMPGDLYDEINRYIYYTATNIVVDGKEIDLTNVDSIAKMPIPRFQFTETTTDLSYQIKMRATKEKNPNIAAVLVPKAAELMRASKIGWLVKDYRRLAQQLWSNDLIAAGDELVETYSCNFRESMHSATAAAKARFRETVKMCSEFGTDLVEMSVHGNTCGECSKYEGRVFSISGNDTRFPKLPSSVTRYGGIHEGCRHIFYPYRLGCSLASRASDPIAYSNRPFIDERTDDQKHNYGEFKKSMDHEERIWNLTSEYYHKRHHDKYSVPETLYKFLEAEAQKET